VTLSAEIGLEKLASDDSKTVANYAHEVLERHRHPEVALPETISSAAPAAEVASPEIPKSEVPASAPPASVSQPVYPPAPLPRTAKSANMGGCLNLLIPGLGYVYAGNWPMAIATFLVAGTILAVLLFALYVYPDSSVLACVFTILLGIYAVLFFMGRGAVIKENKKSGR
jgi:hypothetical protein